MTRLQLFVRLLGIQRVLYRHGLDELLESARLPGSLRFVLALSPAAWVTRDRTRPRAERIRQALEDLGPIFVKFGQSLSTRQDLLPPDVGAELTKLQDQVPPFPGEQARREIEQAFGQPVEALYAEFTTEALAAASIAQVHAARLRDGQDVVVKVLRPGIRQLIERDLEVMYAVSRLVSRYWPEARRLRPVAVVAEYEKTILDELDLLREAANAQQLRRNWQGSPIIYVPEVYFDWCRTNVLTQERIRGINIDDLDALRAARVNIPKLAANGVEIFFTQVFRDNFFHADMHPGNIFVDATDPENPRYCAVDFGIVGTLTETDRRYLAGNFLAFFDRDYYRVAKLHVDSGWVPAGTRVDELESAVRTVCEPIFQKPLKEISFGLVLLQLIGVARRFNMEVQPQLILLQKTLVQIEGLGRVLYPDLDIWQTGKPVLKAWMLEQTGPKATLKRLRRDWPDLRYALERLPQVARRLVDEALEKPAAAAAPAPGGSLPDAAAQLAADRRRWLATVGGSLVIAGAVWVGLAAAPAGFGWLLGGTGLVVAGLGWPRGSRQG
ncbi:MAG: ubiquinone biosynthesis regulatory protein kinase UbiB [Chromatiales bacterium]|jgi:ubiquinone biosynthesis protein|nr:ubiquinone biosynthesis regulatory protein kinase UbiB [Chromatiales bacterium]